MTEPYEHRLTVRYAETDQMGVVHHASYVVYLEEARTRMMAARGCSYGELEKSGIGLPIRKVDVRYRASAFYEDELVIRTQVTRLRAASITFGYEIVRASDEAHIATASTELACVRLDGDRKPVPLPDELRSFAGE